MSKHPRDNGPNLRPVNRIELSEKNSRQRLILVCLLVIIAAAAIGTGIHAALEVQPGWNEIQAACDEPNYSREFHLLYDFSQTDGDASAVNKALSLLYSEAMEDAYRIFSKDADVASVHNLYYLNRHVNEPVTLDETLYNALALLQEAGNRCMYLAPVYVEYNRVFNSESDVEAMLYDPSVDPQAAEYIGQLMTFLSDSGSVDLELLGNNQAILSVSEDYLAFAEENEIEDFVDLAWMRNAFVADYVAELLTEKGYVSGCIGSFDGYNRSLGRAGQLDFNIFDRQETDIYAPGKMTYSGAMSIVFLRDYPLSTLDQWSYHVYADGRITSSMIDPDDGICHMAIANLVSYSVSRSCAELLVEMTPVVFADAFSKEAVMELRQKGIYSIWCEDGTVYYNQENLLLDILNNGQGISYSKEFAAPAAVQ